MAESCIPEIGGNTEEKSRENSSDVEALLRWTSFEEVEDIIGPYVSQAIDKAVYGGYKSAREVYLDYRIFNHAYTQLVEGQGKLMSERYAPEYFYHYALMRKKEMLRRFSTMLSYASLKESDKHWIIIQLLEDNKSEHQLLDTAELNNYWGTNLRMADKDVQSEAIRQKEEKLALLGKFQHNQNEFQADNFLKRKEEFEELKCEISCENNNMNLLLKRASTYYRTLGDIEDEMSDASLRTAFGKLLHEEDEKDLSNMWLEETVRTLELVRQEKEKSDEAERICVADWNKVVASSGLLR